MSFDTSYHVLSLATLGFITLATFLHSFRNRPVPTMKSLSFVLFTVALEFSNQVGWWKMIKIAFPLAVISIGGVLLAWVLVIAYVQRKLILWTEEHSDVAKSLLGRPLLFPTRLTHSRMFPEKYNYWINYFLVGIPVGLRGHIGSLMAIDSDATSPHSQSKLFQITYHEGAEEITLVQSWSKPVSSSRGWSLGLGGKAGIFSERASKFSYLPWIRIYFDFPRARIQKNTHTPILWQFLLSYGGPKALFPTGISTRHKKTWVRWSWRWTTHTAKRGMSSCT